MRPRIEHPFNQLHIHLPMSKDIKYAMLFNQIAARLGLKHDPTLRSDMLQPKIDELLAHPALQPVFETPLVSGKLTFNLSKLSLELTFSGKQHELKALAGSIATFYRDGIGMYCDWREHDIITGHPDHPDVATTVIRRR